MNKIRCHWVNPQNRLYLDYHDTEWGVPVWDDQTQFEFLILEGAQAGLSWETILKRREGYRNAFANFDVEKVAQYDEEKIQKILQNPGIIRNKLKVRSAVNNAQKCIEIQKECGSFCNYIWQFVGGKPKINHYKEVSDIPAETEESNTLSKDLKRRGFSFVGPTIMYAHMQATGMVMDHVVGCFRYEELKETLHSLQGSDTTLAR